MDDGCDGFHEKESEVEDGCGWKDGGRNENCQGEKERQGPEGSKLCRVNNPQVWKLRVHNSNNVAKCGVVIDYPHCRGLRVLVLALDAPWLVFLRKHFELKDWGKLIEKYSVC